MRSDLLKKDLDCLLHYSELWKSLRHASIFVTGGTGFFGKWLLESFVRANAEFNLQAHLCILTRNKRNFITKFPHYDACASVSFHEGDVRNFSFPEGDFTHVIHAATDASAHLNENNPFLMLDTIVEGTRRTLDFARAKEAKEFLLVSSGAVYGRQPPSLSHVGEDFPTQPNLFDHRSAYGVGKCTAEHLGFLYSKQYGLNIKIARCFAFVGPYLPLDIHFAIGNFIRDAVNGDPIIIKGDGSPYRSYLYASDLTLWLWTILTRGTNLRPYNVGSDKDYSIEELAHLVAKTLNPSIEVQVLSERKAGLPERYVPSTERARTELNLQETVSLEEAILRSKDWALSQSCKTSLNRIEI